MPWYDGGGDFIKLPVGTQVEVTIKEINKVTNKPDFDFKNKKGEGQGYHFEFETDKGVLTINAWKLFFALKEKYVDVGDTIKINHKGKGEYIVETLSTGVRVDKESPPDVDVPPEIMNEE